eukprot:10727409-Ditylum_brightwellii.AAC.1
MATHTAPKTKFPGYDAPNAHSGTIMSKSPAAVMPCHKPTGLPTSKLPTKPPNLLSQVKIPSTLPLQMNP